MNAAFSLDPGQKAELLPVAAKVFWWGTPETALEHVTRFVAQVMTYGDWQDVRTTMRVLGEKPFHAVLEDAPPGVFDLKSWNYWNVFFGRIPVPALPQRKL